MREGAADFVSASLDEATAARFAGIALGHVTKVYPNQVALRLNSAADLVAPEFATPIFRGSYDWHSCVHGYWTLARLRRLFPEAEFAARIDALFACEITESAALGERDWLARKDNAGWERPYGWAWALMLVSELRLSEAGALYAERLQPMADVIVRRFENYLPKLTYAVRSGVHSNSAFALILAIRYARIAGAAGLAGAIVDAARRWFAEDAGCRAWGEPSGEDFLSPSLMEAALMARLLDARSFAAWFHRFMPSLPAVLRRPATVSDRSDGRIAHLDGVNLSRAWALRVIGPRVGDPRYAVRLCRAAQAHLDASLPHVAGDYMGEHWLASFALLALSEI
ncbi:MAG: DUF2891 domain-containing protein [Alphaproteobacteria bacterium]|nr:DUF2891 domain-containing protein [Alphaproteobacteria bacterium]